MMEQIDTYCIAPGLRSAPLIAAIPATAKKIIHYDERGLAFFALGVAKATQKPVAMITTSGTAIGNTLPAVMEAYHSHTPLVLLTADRPLSLYHTGANQTTDQIKCMAGYVHYSGAISLNDPHFSRTLNAALVHARKGPIHLNIFIDSLETKALACPRATHSFPNQTAETTCDLPLNTIKRGLIVAGMGVDTDHAATLAHHLQWPLITDILSGIRHLDEIPYWELRDLPPFDAILHLGGALVSKKLQFQKPQFYIQANPDRFDPYHQVTHHFHTAPQHFHLSCPPATHALIPPTPFTPSIAQLPICESALFYHMKTDHPLFISNSIPIRAANAFYFPEHHVPIYANRGLSGIDGNIATACGIVHGTKKPLIAILGDQAFLHDLNSLPLMKHLPAPLQLIICNNGGGRIFGHLDFPQKQACYEKAFANAHDYTFEKAAALFDIPYSKELSQKMRTGITELVIDPYLSENFMEIHLAALE